MRTADNLFPTLEPATYAALKDSIEQFGVLVPVAKDQDGKLIDGYHRSKIADELGVDFRVDVIKVESDEQRDEIAAALNLYRRHLDVSQRREQVIFLRSKGHSLRAIADAVGVSEATARRDVSTASNDAVATPDGKVLGKDGKRRDAKRPTLIAAKNRKETERALSVVGGTELPFGATIDVKNAEKRARTQETARLRGLETDETSVVGDVEIRHGNLADSLSDLSAVDAIITDPPYPKEFIGEFDALGELASRILKPGGILVAMTGQLYLPDYIALLSKHLSYRWCGAYLTPGGATRVYSSNVGTHWKPILVFQKAGGESSFLPVDVFKSEADDKSFHHWGQSESGMRSLIGAFTKQSDVVVDPFLGGGTTAVACQQMGRKFIGCDIDAAAIHTARERTATTLSAAA